MVAKILKKLRVSREKITNAKNFAYILAQVCPFHKLLLMQRKANESAIVAIIIVFAVRHKALNHADNLRRSSDPDTIVVIHKVSYVLATSLES